MDHRCLHPSLDGVVAHGAARNRRDRPIRNGYWYLATRAGIEPAGWGDLSFVDLDAVAAHLDPSVVFVVVSERSQMRLLSFGSTREDGSDRSDDWPLIEVLVADATYAVNQGRVWFVDHRGAANRLGVVWIRPGYRVAATGRVIRTRQRRVAAISPHDLDRALRTATRRA